MKRPASWLVNSPASAPLSLCGLEFRSSLAAALGQLGSALAARGRGTPVAAQAAVDHTGRRMRASLSPYRHLRRRPGPPRRPSLTKGAILAAWLTTQHGTGLSTTR